MIRKLRYFSLVTFVPRSKEEEKTIPENICGQSVLVNVKAWAWPRICSAACLNTDPAYVLGGKGALERASEGRLERKGGAV